MKRSVVLGILAILTLVFTLSLLIKSESEQKMAFGGKKDVEFAKMLWKTMDGYEKWPMESDVYPGTSPQGENRLCRLE